MDDCHCLYLSSIPKKILLFYVENLKKDGINHPQIDLLEDLCYKLLDDEINISDYFEIEDVLVLVLLSMMERNRTFQAVLDRMNDLSSQFYGMKSPKINKNEPEDIMNIARKYWNQSPQKIVKSYSNEEFVILKRRNSGSKTPSPRITY